jgi:membrane protein YdbS with pleckstrin-like domain
MQTKLEKTEEKEIICRKCNAVYIFWWIIFFVILLMMFMCLFLDFGTVWKSSVLQFFFLAELVVAIVVFEEYMDILILWKNWIRFESGILVKNRKEIPYDKINSVNIHSAFWFGTLEILTGNDIMTRYRFLHEYDKVEKLIKSRINSEK